MANYPEGYLYSKEHEWLDVDGDICTLGITQFAQDELGEVVFVELPEVGESHEEGDEIGSIESVKAVAEIYCPVAGEVVEANAALDDSPELVNEDPHGEGWICKLKLADGFDSSTLMSAEAYAEFVAGSGDE